MPLSPPPDYSKLVLPLALGAGGALVLYTLTRSSLPHVGDNIHHLPHGGKYRDGTKSIDYCSPARKFPSSNLFGSGNFSILLLVLFLIALIYALEQRSRSSRRICVCGVPSCSEQQRVQ